jgi:copper chaperone NosL
MSVRSFYVMDYAHPGRVIAASDAAFLVSPNLPSPMGANVSSFAEQTAAGNIQKDKGGDVMDWDTIQKHIREWAKS